MAVASPTSRFVRASAAGLQAWARQGGPGLLLVVPAGFCLVFLALFSPVVFQGNLLAPHDGKHFFIPAYRTLEKLWGPWELSGFPVVGDPQEMSWYPLSLLLSLWPGTWNAFVISGYVLAAFLMFLFVRELSDSESGLVAALSYSLGGFALWNLSMINIVHSAAWLPGVLLGLEKLRKDPTPGWVAWTGGAAACCVLAGHPQTAVYAGVVAIVFVGFSAARSRTGAAGYLAACAAAGVIALLLSAILWVPMVELAGWSARSSISEAVFEGLSLDPGSWTEFLVPYAPARLRAPESASAWALRPGMAYVGCLPLLLAGAAFARGRRLLASCFTAVALVALLLAAAPHIPLGEEIYRIPGLNRFRAPVRHLFEASFALSVLAGLGSANLRRPGTTPLLLRVAVVAGATVLFALAWRLVRERGAGAIAVGGGGAETALLIQIILWVASCGVFLLLKGGSRVLRVSLLVLLLADLGLHASFGEWRERFAPPEDFHAPPVIQKYRDLLDRTGQRFTTAVRFHRNPGTGPANRHRLWRMAGAHGYNPLCLQRYSDLYGYNVFGRVKPAVSDSRRCALDVLAVRYVLAPDDWKVEIPALSRGESWRLVETMDGVRVYENRADPPRAWMVSEALVLSPDEVLKTLETSRLPNGDVFDPRRVALLETPVPLGPGGEGGKAQARVIGPGSIDVEVSTDGPGLLVLSDIWYPGWEAFAGDEKLEIHRCDYVIMAVAVPPGESRVQFRFRPVSFRVGVALSVLGLLGAGALGARRFRSAR